MLEISRSLICLRCSSKQSLQASSWCTQQAWGTHDGNALSRLQSLQSKRRMLLCERQTKHSFLGFLRFIGGSITSECREVQRKISIISSYENGISAMVHKHMVTETYTKLESTKTNTKDPSRSSMVLWLHPKWLYSIGSVNNVTQWIPSTFLI